MSDRSAAIEIEIARTVFDNAPRAAEDVRRITIKSGSSRSPNGQDVAVEAQSTDSKVGGRIIG